MIKEELQKKYDHDRQLMDRYERENGRAKDNVLTIWLYAIAGFSCIGIISGMELSRVFLIVGFMAAACLGTMLCFKVSERLTHDRYMKCLCKENELEERTYQYGDWICADNWEVSLFPKAKETLLKLLMEDQMITLPDMESLKNFKTGSGMIFSSSSRDCALAYNRKNNEILFLNKWENRNYVNHPPLKH